MHPPAVPSLRASLRARAPTIVADGRRAALGLAEHDVDKILGGGHRLDRLKVVHGCGLLGCSRLRPLAGLTSTGGPALCGHGVGMSVWHLWERQEGGGDTQLVWVCKQRVRRCWHQAPAAPALPTAPSTSRRQGLPPAPVAACMVGCPRCSMHAANWRPQPSGRPPPRSPAGCAPLLLSLRALLCGFGGYESATRFMLSKRAECTRQRVFRASQGATRPAAAQGCRVGLGGLVRLQTPGSKCL
jgi:hypothetical protein